MPQRLGAGRRTRSRGPPLSTPGENKMHRTKKNKVEGGERARRAESPSRPVPFRPGPAPRFPRSPRVSVARRWVSAPGTGGAGRRSVGPRQGEGGGRALCLRRTGRGKGREGGGLRTRAEPGSLLHPASPRGGEREGRRGGSVLLLLPPPPFSPFLLLLLSPKLNFLLPARLGRGRAARPDSALDTHNSWSCQNFLRSASAPAASSAAAAACSSSAPGGSARGEGAGAAYNEAAAAAAGQHRSRQQLPGPLRGGSPQPRLARRLPPDPAEPSRGRGVIVCETLRASALFSSHPPPPPPSPGSSLPSSSRSPHAAPPATCAGRRRLRPAMRGGGGGGGGEEERSRGSRRSIGIPITILIFITIIHVSLSSC